MNKIKEELLALRTYLQRDPHGTKLLEIVTKSANDQRKRIASLEQSVRDLTSIVQTLREDNKDGKEKIDTLTQALEAERQKHDAIRKHKADLLERIAKLESEAEVDEEIPVAAGFRRFDQTIALLPKISKEVRKRFKRPPQPFNRKQCFRLESVVKKFTSHEFESLGMLITMLALMGFPALVKAETLAKDMAGFDERMIAQFVHWYRTWIVTTPTHEKILGGVGPWKGQMEETTPFTPRRRKGQEDSTELRDTEEMCDEINRILEARIRDSGQDAEVE